MKFSLNVSKEEVAKARAEGANDKAVLEEAAADVATSKVEMAGTQMDEVKANATDNFETMLEELIQERKEARYQRYIEKRRKDLSDIILFHAKIQKLLE